VRKLSLDSSSLARNNDGMTCPELHVWLRHLYIRQVRECRKYCWSRSSKLGLGHTEVPTGWRMLLQDELSSTSDRMQGPYTFLSGTNFGHLDLDLLNFLTQVVYVAEGYQLHCFCPQQGQTKDECKHDSNPEKCEL
jgi:hypothetical protein